MNPNEDAIVKVGEKLSDREHLLSLLSQDEEQSRSQTLERSFGSSLSSSRRAWFLLTLMLLAFVGTDYALRMHGREGMPRRVAGVLFSGICRPSGEVRVSTESLGTVAEILVKPGDVVDKGQVLIKMDDEDAVAALNDAELQRSIALQNLSSLRTRYAVARARAALSQQEERLLPARQLRDSPERAQAAYDQVLKSYERTEALVRLGTVAQQSLDDKESELRIAKDDLDIAHKLERASVQAASDQTQQIQAETDLERERNEQALRRADLQVAECRRRLLLASVRAPARGVVAEVLAHEGDRLPSGVALVRIAQLHTMVVEVPVAAELVPQLHRNQAVTVRLPTLPIREVDGAIRTINPLPSANMTHTVEVEFHNDDLQLFAGQPAKVRFSQP